jgi:hypothetical protein
MLLGVRYCEHLQNNQYGHEVLLRIGLKQAQYLIIFIAEINSRQDELDQVRSCLH